jgi:hypothetical protein
MGSTVELFVHIRHDARVEDGLNMACKQAGLVNAEGKPTVTPHRFHRTVGELRADGGARIQKITSGTER